MQLILASGNPYTLTASLAKVAFSTTSPRVVVNAGLTRLLSVRAMVDLSNCTLDSPRVITLLLRRITGTPVDLSRSETTIKVGSIATSGQNEVDVPIVLPPIIVTPTVSSTFELWAKVDSLPSTGIIQIREASILSQ